MRIVYFGSGSFGIPCLRVLHDRHDIALIVTQPARPAGRSRRTTSTPVGDWAAEHGIDVLAVDDVNSDGIRTRIQKCDADLFVVIDYGQKLGKQLLSGATAVNVHASLLPAYRGAAPVQWAMINGETNTGITVIEVTERIDEGDVLGSRETGILPDETAGELEDRLADMSPELLLDVLARKQQGILSPVPQDASRSSMAPRMSRSDALIDLGQPAAVVRAAIHGRIPWPGCTAWIAGEQVKIIRVCECDMDLGTGVLDAGGYVGCAGGALRILLLQPSGGRQMAFDEYAHGRDIPFPTALEMQPPPDVK